MKFSPSLRLAVLPLALSAVFPALAQSQLAPVMVTATRFADQADALPLGVSVITAEEIHISGASTVNEAIMRLLGVVGRQDYYGGGDYSLDLRGFGVTADNNQVVIVDGVRLNEADLGGTRLAGIPIDGVERIEILRGSGSVLYGEGSTGGVIIVTTKAGIGKERMNAATAYAGVGSHGLREARANATLVSGGFSLDVAASRRDSDNHRDNFVSSAEGQSFLGQWSDDSLRLGARYAVDTLDTRLPGALSLEQWRANPRQTNTPDDSAVIKNERGAVFAELQLTDWQLAFDVGSRTKSLVNDYTAYGSRSRYAYDIDAQNAGLRAQHEASLGSARNQLQMGTDHAEWNRTVLGNWGSVANQSSHAWYIKDDVTLTGAGTRLSTGWRTERLSKSNTGASAPYSDDMQAWEIGLSQVLPFNWTVYGRLGSSFRLPNVDEFGYTSPGVSLLPQTSRDAELGARWKQDRATLDARVYRNKLNNEIGFNPVAEDPFSSPYYDGANINFAPTQRQGIEIDVRYQFGTALELRGNAAWRDSSFRSGVYADKKVPLAPARILGLRADWKPMPGHRLSGGVNWVSSQFADFDNRYRMSAYTTADLRYAYQWNQAELSLAINNLFDRKYYSQATVNDTGLKVYPEADRTVVAGLRLRF